MPTMWRAEREGASLSISSDQSQVEMGMRPSRIVGMRPAACTFNFLLHKHKNQVGVELMGKLTILLSKTGLQSLRNPSENLSCICPETASNKRPLAHPPPPASCLVSSLQL